LERKASLEVSRTETSKSEVPKFLKDIRTAEDLTVGSSWTKTLKNEVLKLQSRQRSENFVKPKRFFAHVEL
jgi:hypothetical protein